MSNWHELLQSILPPDGFFTDTANCWAYAYDNSELQYPPQAVCLPQTRDQVVQIIECCYQHRIPVFTRGRGTGTTGGSVPTGDGIVLSLERMDQIKSMEPENRFMVVEPGVTNAAVQQLAGNCGLFFAPDPTSAAYCTVGGNLSVNASGPRSVKYGSCRENTLGLTMVTGTGAVLKCGVKTSKGVVGYDLTRLLIGSEGTLAVIVEATLQLIPIPPLKRSIRMLFNSLPATTDTIIHIMSQYYKPCAVEFMDVQAVKLATQHAKLNLDTATQALLMVEYDGTETSIEESIQLLLSWRNNPGIIDIRIAQDEQDIQQLWAARRALSPALRQMAPRKINEDVVVPISKLTALLLGLQRLSIHHHITIVNFGHAGNGNIHVNLLWDTQDSDAQKRAHECLSDVFDLVLSLEGTLSGEHGIGLVKREFIAREIDSNALDIMKKIKSQFDPHNILNPGKSI